MAARLVLSKTLNCRKTAIDIRAWPSGKAPGFGPGIRGFESLRPSQYKKVRACVWLFYIARSAGDSNDRVLWTLAALKPEGLSY